MVNPLIEPTPLNWPVRPLGELCELVAGTMITDDAQGSVPVVKAKNLLSGRVAGVIDRTNSNEASLRSRYQIKAGDLLSVRTGSIGRVALANSQQEGWLFGTGLIRLRPDDSVDPLFLSLYLTDRRVQEWLLSHSVGTAIPSINTKTLASLPVSLPPIRDQLAIGRTLDTLSRKIAAHESVCQATAELRGALLPLLLSGQVTPAPEGPVS